MKKFIETGKIVAPFGIKGEVKIYPWSDSPEDLTNLSRLYVKGGSICFQIESSKVHKNMVIAKLSGVNTVEDAEKLREYVVYLNREDISLPKGVYFNTDLLGIKVIDADSEREYGVLSDIFKGGSGEIYTIKMENGKEFMLPVIPETVISTDIENGILKIRLLKGLLDDED